MQQNGDYKTKHLFAQNRLEDAKRAAEDAAYCDALMKQYGIS